MQSARLLLKRSSTRYLPFLLLYTLLAAGLALCTALVSQQSGALGGAASASDLAGIAKGMAAMAVMTGGRILFGALAELLRGRFAGRAAHALRRGFAGHIVRISYKALSKFQSGDLLSVYGNDLPLVYGMLAEEVPVLILQGTGLLAAIGFMLAIHPVYTLIFFALYPLLTWMQIAISKPIQPLVEDLAKKRGEYNAVILDSLQNTAAIAAYSLGDSMEERYDRAYEGYFRARMRQVSLFSLLIISGLLATFVPTVFLSVASALSVARGGMTFGGFLAITMIAESAGDFLSMLSQSINNLRICAASAKRLQQHMQDEEEALRGDVQKDPHAPAIAFEDVSFSYSQGGRRSLEHVSFSIERGSRVAIVGPSGSGKSTAAKLIQALYEPDEGSVRLMGARTAGNPKGALRRNVACVPQDAFLFPESIRANVTCARQEGEADEARLEAACRGAGIHDFVLSLPQGYDTVLAEGGENLSGGQRQRLSIARALYMDAPILLMDEATAALDPSTERAVLEGLGRSARGKTIVVIAHRLAAIADCDRILVMEDGRLVEDGTFEELMGRDSAFAGLYRRQMRG